MQALIEHRTPIFNHWRFKLNQDELEEKALVGSNRGGEI